MEASRSTNSKIAAAKTAPALRLEGVGVSYRFEKGNYPAVERADLTVAELHSSRRITHKNCDMQRCDLATSC